MCTGAPESNHQKLSFLTVKKIAHHPDRRAILQHRLPICEWKVINFNVSFLRCSRGNLARSGTASGTTSSASTPSSCAAVGYGTFSGGSQGPVGRKVEVNIFFCATVGGGTLVKSVLRPARRVQVQHLLPALQWEEVDCLLRESVKRFGLRPVRRVHLQHLPALQREE